MTTTTTTPAVKTFVEADLRRLQKYREELAELHKFVINRAELYTQMTLKDENINFQHQNGFGATIFEYEVFAKQEILRVDYHDFQYGGKTTFKVPYAFVFGAPTAEEIEYAKYIELKKKFADKK